MIEHIFVISFFTFNINNQSTNLDKDIIIKRLNDFNISENEYKKLN